MEREGAKQGGNRGKETACWVFLKDDYKRALKKSLLRCLGKIFQLSTGTPPTAICRAWRLWSEGLCSLKRSVKTILSGTNGGSLSHPQLNPNAPLKQASSRLSLCSTASEWGPMISSLGDTRWAPDFKRQRGDRQRGGPCPSSHKPFSVLSPTSFLSISSQGIHLQHQPPRGFWLHFCKATVK